MPTKDIPRREQLRLPTVKTRRSRLWTKLHRHPVVVTFSAIIGVLGAGTTLRMVGDWTNPFLHLAHPDPLSDQSNQPGTQQSRKAADAPDNIDGFINATTACALGLKIEIKGDLQGSLRTFYNGMRTSGNISSNAKTEFLVLFPESERMAAYELYTGCLARILKKEDGTGTSGSPQPDQEYLAYKGAVACIESSCVFERCLATYTTMFPFGTGATFLEAEAERAGNSPRCKPPERMPTSKVKCVTFNGKQVCG